jgi:hypothetical protein
VLLASGGALIRSVVSPAYLQINRCVRCSANGTYSLNPFTNETIGCQPCPNGGLCQNGLLAPRSGYYSYNPFVPQILPCPLKGACTGSRRIGAGLSPEFLRELQRQKLGSVDASETVTSGADHRHDHSAWDWGNNQRRRLADASALSAQGGVGAAGGGDAPEGHSHGSRSPVRRSAPHLHELQDGYPGWDSAQHPQQSQQQQPQEQVVSRRQALMGYNKLVAQLWANDSTDGIPLLIGIEFTSLLDAWHRLQCNPG